MNSKINYIIENEFITNNNNEDIIEIFNKKLATIILNHEKKNLKGCNFEQSAL